MNWFKKFMRSGPFSSLTQQQKRKIFWDSVAVLTIAVFALIAYLGYMLLQPPEVTLGGVPVSDLAADATDTPKVPAGTEDTELVMLDRLVEWYAENPDLVGWLRIDGTVIDYPVVHTPEDENKYLRKNFNGKFSMEGTLLVGAVCSIEPESSNIIIYGHNMRKGTMFHDLLKYKSKSFWEEHPIIEFSTLYEERQYEIIAVFYDRIYGNQEKVFKFYNFAEYLTREEFDEAVTYYQKMAEYDTGVEPVFGDRLLTLVTCSYHVKNGRFVVVARQITEDPVPTETTPVA